MDNEAVEAAIENMRQQEMLYRQQQIDANQTGLSTLASTLLGNGFGFDIGKVDYFAPLGLTYTQSGLLSALEPRISIDKDGLTSWNHLLDIGFEPKLPGFLFGESFAIMLTRYFRRGYSPTSNYAPALAPLLWSIPRANTGADLKIKLDPDRVRINLDLQMYMEDDVWYGPRFEDNISQIQDGNTVLRPPTDIDDHLCAWLFANTYALNISWSTSVGIKTFQAIEFKSAEVHLDHLGNKRFPVRYIHAEYEEQSETIRHLDGAIHFYSEDDYLSRRDLDFNFLKNSSPLEKALSVKIFRLDGTLSVKIFIEICSHFFTANPLIHEYFTGSYPQSTCQHIANARSS